MVGADEEELLAVGVDEEEELLTLGADEEEELLEAGPDEEELPMLEPRSVSLVSSSVKFKGSYLVLV